MGTANILIVEDELIVALELEDRLRQQGYDIAGIARTYEHALEIIERTPVDLALLDIRLASPRDGIELAEALRPWDLPVVFLTAHGDKETLRRVKAVDAQGYLLKPFNARLLGLTIETALHRHASERARLAAERARQRSEAMQATILAHTPEAVLVLGDAGVIELANEAARRIFGLEGRGSWELGDLLPELTAPAALDQEPGVRVDTVGRRSDGSRFPVEFSAGIAPLEEGERVVLLARDVSVQRELESELARARGLELVGRLASGVAHDINNLLSIVGMSSYLLADARDAERVELLEDLDAAVELGEALTRRLLTLAQRDHRGGAPSEVELNEVLRRTQRLIRRCVGVRVRVEFELEPEAGTVRVDPIQLEQVILNLGINANRAMPDGGRLSVRSRVACDSSDAAWIVIEIEDTGVGIPPDIQRRVFEPFFTTRNDSGGTGLGLAIVKEVIERAGGTLALESRPGEGTRFELRLPRVGESAGASPAETPAPAPLEGRGRHILLVDDDALHRRSTARLLHAWGFEVTPASGPGEALLIAERSEAEFTLALADIHMPLMNGFELAARLRQSRAELPVLLLSGSLDSEEIPPDQLILRKPLAPEQLQRAIAHLSTHSPDLTQRNPRVTHPSPDPGRRR